ncbi:MAG: DUF6036 family nucleotidyltransferase [Acidimicrobiales bacterium]
MSVEVDIAALDDPDDRKADLIDGAIGEASVFHESFGYYAQGVSKTTAVLAAGWQDRLRRYESPATNGVVAWCLETHDLWLSKAAAMRHKDIEFCDALLHRAVVQPDTLRARLADLPGVADEVRARIAALIDRAAPDT